MGRGQILHKAMCDRERTRAFAHDLFPSGAFIVGQIHNSCKFRMNRAKIDAAAGTLANSRVRPNPLELDGP